MPTVVHATAEEVCQLMDALGSESQAVRYAAAETLLAVGEAIEAATGVLVEALHSEDDGDSQLAATALVALGARAVAPLEDGLQDPRGEVRRVCAHALGELGPAALSVAEALADVVDDENAEVRGAAVRAIAQLGPGAKEPAGSALVAAIRDDCVLVRYSAAMALLRLGHELGRAVPPLIEALCGDQVHERRSAAECLAGIGEPARLAIPELTQALEDDDSLVRAAVIRALGAQGKSARSAFPQISVMADDERQPPEVREAAEWALERLV